MQSDMAEEGSGAWSEDNINNDDEEYSDFSGSGDSTDRKFFFFIYFLIKNFSLKFNFALI